MYWCAPWFKWVLLAAGGVGGYAATRKRKTKIKVGASIGSAGLGYLIGYLLQRRCVFVVPGVPEYVPLSPADSTDDVPAGPMPGTTPRFPGVSVTESPFGDALEVLSPPSARPGYRPDTGATYGERANAEAQRVEAERAEAGAEPASGYPGSLTLRSARGNGRNGSAFATLGDFSPWGTIEGLGGQRSRAQTRTSGMFRGSYGS